MIMQNANELTGSREILKGLNWPYHAEIVKDNKYIVYFFLPQNIVH